MLGGALGAPRVDRRGFLRSLGLGGLALALGARPQAAAAAAQPPRVGSPAKIGAAPADELQAAARRAREGLLARLDRAAGYRPHFLLDLSGEVARLIHDDYWDGVDLGGRTVDGLIRLGRVLGDGPGDAELQLRDYFLGRQGDDGLFYGDGPDDSQVADSFCQGRALLGLTTWFASGGDGEVEARLQGLVGGLAAIAVHRDDYSYFPGRRYRGGWLDYGLMGPYAYDGLDNYGYGEQCALALMEYHALSGDHAALQLAGRLLRHFVFHSGQVDPEGRFAGETHAGGYLPVATAALRYGVATGDETYVAWADRLYRWVRANSSEFGWVPGPLGLGAAYFERWYAAPVRRTCETCSVADALNLAILLASQGHTEYWDDVERYTRNQLLQNQFGTAEAVLGPEGCARAADDVQRAIAGAWESFALPYRLLARPDDRRLVEGCCSGSGARALGLVWEHAVERRGGTLYVHLGLTRDSALARVISHEPAAGRLDVVPRTPLALRLRVPTWAAADTVTLWVAGQQREPRREGPYVAVDEVAADTRVTLRYGLRERVEHFAVNDETTVAHWRGGTVLDVEPDTGPAPIYRPQRAALLARSSLTDSAAAPERMPG